MKKAKEWPGWALRGVTVADGALLWEGEGEEERDMSRCKRDLQAAEGAQLQGVGVGEFREIEIVAFRQDRNRRFLRVRDEDLPALAAGFVGAPFLRNHDEADIESRDGVVVASGLQAGADGVTELRQRVRLTTQRGRRALAEGQIDRFSIAFDVAGWRCSVCGADWLACDHWPGRSYLANGRSLLCELVAEGPVAREVSAVNVPAVDGTGLLVDLCACKDELREMPLSGEEREEEMAVLSMTKGDELVAEKVAAQKGAAQFEAEKSGGEQGGACHAASVNLHAQEPREGVQAGRSETQVALDALRREVAAVESLRAGLAAEQREVTLHNSGLSVAGQQVVRLGVVAGGDLGELVEAQQAAEVALLGAQGSGALVRGNRAVEGAGGLSQMRSEQDRAQEVMDWSVGLHAAAVPAPNLRSLRELYLAVTGDYAFQGKVEPEQAQFAAATTATLPGLAANALNKVILQHFEAMSTWRWYEPLVGVVPHDGSTQDVQLIMMDGVANLSTVAEGNAYTELSVGDSKESLSFVKKGNYVGITLEMFRRSEIGKMQAIPRLMALASLRTRSAAIASIFTANAGAGPTLAEDSKALFHVDHGNLSTVAFGGVEWAAMRKRIWSQVVPGTSKKLGMWPTFVLVPIDLYDAALAEFGYGTGDVGKPSTAGTAQSVNPYAASRPGDPRPIPVAVPDWSDANDWACLVDPRLHPVVQMAYANAPAGGAHPAPEFFAATSETQGLMFTNDTLAVKVRDWWGYAVATYVGIGKNNVA